MQSASDATGMTTDRRATGANITLDDVRPESREQWDITPIKGGYPAVLRGSSSPAPVALYGRTPGELAESIRIAETSQ